MTVLTTETEIQEFETRGFHVWPAVCVWDRCCAIDEPGSCAGEAGGELHPEVYELSS